MEIYGQFLAVLVSLLPKYLGEVTGKLVTEFSRVPATAESHHGVLRRIIAYTPTCVNSLPQTLHRHFPHHMSSSTKEINNYVANLLRVTQYCSDIQFDVWQLVTECCIKLDVELQNELDDLDDDEIEELINGSDDEDEIEPVEEAEGAGEQAFLMEAALTQVIQRLAAKLDSIIHLLLTETQHSFTSEELDSGRGVALFNTITLLFRSHVLPTHFTKLIQFALFHVLQHQPELADLFLVLLIDVAFNQKEIVEKRLKAMQYLLSYVARAKGLLRHQVVFIASYLVGWLDKYVVERENEVGLGSSEESGAGMERFKLFYAAFQALLYIFCFRHQLLVKEDGEWECGLEKFFQRVIVAKFNPLKYCDETVVFIFAKLATKLNVCYCYLIIEHNKRERMLQHTSALPLAVGSFKQKQEFLDLEAYFPFDPLVLPLSKQVISKNYVEWTEVNPNEDDDDDDSGSHRENDDDDDVVSSDEEITSEEDDDE